MRFFQLRVIVVSGQLAFSPARCTAYFFAGRILQFGLEEFACLSTPPGEWLCVLVAHVPEWRNWQTRWIQNPLEKL